MSKPPQIFATTIAIITIVSLLIGSPSVALGFVPELLASFLPAILSGGGGGGGASGPEALQERRKEDQKQCEAEAGKDPLSGLFGDLISGGTDSAGRQISPAGDFANPDVAPPPLLPATRRTPWEAADDTPLNAKIPAWSPLTWLRTIPGQPVTAQSATFSLRLDSFSNINALTARLTRDGFSRDLTSFLEEVGDLGGNISHLSGSYSTIGDLANIRNLGQVSEVFGQAQNLGGNMQVMLQGSGSLGNLVTKLNVTGNLPGLAASLGQIKNLNGTFAGLTGGIGGFGNLINSFGDISDLQGLSGMFGQLSNLGGSFQSLTQGFNGFGGMLSGIKKFGNFGQLNQFFGQIGNLGGNFQGMLGGVGDFGNFFSSVGNINGFSDVTNVMGQFSKLGGSFDSFTSGFNGLSDSLTKISGLPNLTDLPKSLSVLSQSGVGIDKVLGANGGNMLGLTNNFATGGAAGLLQPFAATPGIGSIIQSVFSGDFLSGLGVLGGLLAVPVTETGSLLSTTKNIDSTTGQIKTIEEQTNKLTQEIKDLLIQTCTHLKIVRRIQEFYEQKEFVDDPGSSAAAAKALNDAKNSYIENVITKGYQTNQTGVEGAEDEGRPLFNQDTDRLLAEKRKEVDDNFIDELKKSADNNQYAESLATTFREQTALTHTELTKPTLTKEEIEEFLDNPETLDSETWWGRFRAINRPVNNIHGQYLIQSGERDRRQATEEENLREELVAGQGFLPSRVCDEWIGEEGSKVCKTGHWTTVTPAAVHQGTLLAYLTSILRKLEASDESGEDKIKAAALELEAEVKNLVRQEAVAEKSIFKKNDPCPGPEPCPDANWEADILTNRPLETDDSLGSDEGGGSIVPATGVAETIRGVPGVSDGLAEQITRELDDKLPGLASEAGSVDNLPNVLTRELPNIMINVNGFTNLPEASKPSIIERLLEWLIGLIQNNGR